MANEPKGDAHQALGRIALKRLRMPAPTGDPEVDRRALLVALSERFGVPALDLEQVCIRLVDLGCIPRDLAKHHCLMPVLSEPDRVFVAMRNPSDRGVVHEVEFVSGRKVYAYVAPAHEISRLIDQAYAARDRGDSRFVGMCCPAATLEQAMLLDSPKDSEVPPAGPEGNVSGDPSVSGHTPSWPPEQADLQTDEGMRRPVASVPAGPLSLMPLSIPDELIPREDAAPHRTVSALPPGVSSLPPALDGRAMATPFAESSADILSALEEAFDDDQEEASAVCRPSEFPMVGTKIALLVDEEGGDFSLLRALVQEEGFEVRFAKDGGDALQKIKERPPELLILSAMLPVIHGFEVARRLRETQRYAAIPIIVVASSYGEESGADDLRQSCGVDHYVRRPLREADVRRTIYEALQTKRDEPSRNLSQRVEQALEDGLSAYREGKEDEAIQFLEKGAALDPLAYRLHFHLGLLYARRGRTFDGIRALERAVEINPHHFAGLKNLAIVYFQAGFRRRAAELWERGLPLAPDEETRKAIREHLAGLPSQEVLS